MKSIKLPFGLNKNNALVHVTDVERGKSCNCFCPDCKSPLIASKGTKKQPHFKHAVDNNCEGGLESAIHLAAKQIIREKKQISLSAFILKRSVKDSKNIRYVEEKTVIKRGTIVQFDSIIEEAELHGMRVDILAKKGMTRLIIEIFYRHKVDTQKRQKIVDANISAIEIDLSDLTSDDVRNWQAFELSLNDPKRVEWLHNAKARHYYPELEKKLIKIISDREKKYQQEERKENREKKQLLGAIEDLKILSSEESIAKLKQKAEMHPIWNYYSQWYVFSFNELPDFVNADVPNGDWIFGCDKRIWQTAFYKSFIMSNDKPFSIMNVDRWLQDKVGLKIPQAIKIVGIYARRYHELIPVDIYHNRPSSWKTLLAYFNYLRDLGSLEFANNDYHNPGNKWFRVVNKQKTQLINSKSP